MGREERAKKLARWRKLVGARRNEPQWFYEQAEAMPSSLSAWLCGFALGYLFCAVLAGTDDVVVVHRDQPLKWEDGDE